MARLPLALFALVWLSCAWFGSWEWNPNSSTRLFAAISLAEDGDATIDEFAPLTIDKARFGDHYFLDKAPGMTLMAVPVVALADAVTGERATTLPKRLGDPALGRFLRLRLRLTVALVVAPLTALAAVLLYLLLLGETGSAAAGMVAALGFALASPVWGWSTTLFGHAVVADLYLVAVYAVWRGTPRWAALAGFALGWVVVVEYQAVLAGSAIGLWALWRLRERRWPDRVRWLVAFLVGGLIAGAGLVGYNFVAFGTPFRLGYSGVVGWEGMNEGLFGLTWPHPHPLLEILVGPRRGLVWVAPALALAPLGLAAAIRTPVSRALAGMAVAVATIVLLVNASYVYWDGGFSTGPRHPTPAIGLLAIGLGFRWTQGSRRAIAALVGIGIALNLCIASAEIVSPDFYRFPLWSRVIAGQFAAGQLRTFPSEWLGVSPWTGLACYLALAVALGGWIAVAVLHSAGCAMRGDGRSVPPPAPSHGR